MRVAVVQVNNESQGDLVVLQMVKKRAPGCAVFRQGPARPMNNEAGLMNSGVNLPEFFETDAVVLCRTFMI